LGVDQDSFEGARVTACFGDHLVKAWPPVGRGRGPGFHALHRPGMALAGTPGPELAELVGDGEILFRLLGRADASVQRHDLGSTPLRLHVLHVRAGSLRTTDGVERGACSLGPDQKEPRRRGGRAYLPPVQPPAHTARVTRRSMGIRATRGCHAPLTRATATG
jgi:hypothetical protein